MACHTELRELVHLAAGEQLRQVRADDAGQQHKGLAATRQFFRQLDHTRQDAWHLEDGDFVVSAKRILATQMDDEVQRFVGHLRQRVRRVNAYRDQQGFDLAVEVGLHPLALGSIAFAVREHADAFFLEGGQQDLVVEPVLLVHHGPGVFDDARQVAGEMVVFARSVRRFHVRGHAHLEEFIEVGRHDAHIAQALQQGHVLAARPIQHALVEGKDAQVSVEQSRAAFGQLWGRNGLDRHEHIRQKVSQMTNSGLVS